ncbi:MAG: hypothetical protein D8M52_10685 [Chlorobi bacterium]|nr:hypothetical protein [Ignavibacteriota bacterium]MBL1162163.1 hypothetical protein [Chlorobiota bacterium]MCO6447168.1 hypothetical protein [Ignavibacterium album]HOJ07234.1 hypothetical protein [Ignavibacteriaceae bacterium]NOG68625.1 hypothetical protein [Chlorobiota bacterium]
MKTDKKLQELLNKYNDKGEEIREYILAKDQKRFSRKKIVADLGEYYFYLNCKSIFRGLEQEEKATADFDFKAKINPKISYQNFPNKNIIRIEVKTRHAQVNDPYLLGVKKNKFDLLVFVHLNEDYSCRYIGIMKKDKMIVKGNQNRLVFNKSVPIVWETAPFQKIPGK